MDNIETSVPQYSEIELMQIANKDLLLALAAQFDAKISKLETMMESYEQQIAVLATGFAEQAVFIEAMLGQITFPSEESKKNFHNSLHEARQKMYTIMRQGASELVEDGNPRLAEALENVVDSKIHFDTLET